jgi:hypothetical protein
MLSDESCVRRSFFAFNNQNKHRLARACGKGFFYTLTLYYDMKNSSRAGTEKCGGSFNKTKTIGSSLNF